MQSFRERARETNNRKHFETVEELRIVSICLDIDEMLAGTDKDDP
jgi:hypothetical protein